MDTATEVTTQPVTLTQAAADAVRDVMAKKNLKDYSLRLFISGGGCSGFQYGLVLVDKITPDDTVVETDGIKLIIDEESIKYLQGASVDYVNGLTSSGFKISNPNALSSCSCGQSFNSSGSDTGGSCSGCE